MSFQCDLCQCKTVDWKLCVVNISKCCTRVILTDLALFVVVCLFMICIRFSITCVKNIYMRYSCLFAYRTYIFDATASSDICQNKKTKSNVIQDNVHEAALHPTPSHVEIIIRLDYSPFLLLFDCWIGFGFLQCISLIGLHSSCTYSHSLIRKRKRTSEYSDHDPARLDLNNAFGKIPFAIWLSCALGWECFMQQANWYLSWD